MRTFSVFIPNKDEQLASISSKNFLEPAKNGAKCFFEGVFGLFNAFWQFAFDNLDIIGVFDDLKLVLECSNPYFYLETFRF